jgi:outer membrane receptor protein involved in Fe transport
MQLIPFIDVTNPLDTSMGNPDLTPEFIHAVELTYNYQYSRTNSLMVSAYYQYTNDLIQRYRRFNDNGTTFSQNRNLATGTTYGVELTQKHNLLSWWDATINLNLFRNHIDGENLDPTLSRSGYGGFMKLISNTKLKHGFNMQVTANYNAPTVISQGSIDAYGNVDFAIKKSFFHNLATLTFTAADIFNTIQTRTHYNLYPFYNQEVLRKNQTRSIGINLQIKLASKTTEQSNGDATRKQPAAKKEKEGKSRDENLKKDEGGGDENSGGSKENR